MAPETAGITEITAPDPVTVEITTKAPDAILPKRLAAIMIVEPDLWTKDEAAFALKPIGTGPWQLADWGRSSGKAVFTAFKKSWRAPAQLDRLEIAILPDGPSRLSAIQSGQVDLAENFSPEDLTLLEGLPLKAVTERSTQVMALALPNVGNEGKPLHDKRVRQALNYAVDREQIVATILSGKSQAASQGCTVMVFGCNPHLQPYPYDPAKAKALLKEAGYGDGFSMRVEVLTGFGQSDQLIYQRVAEQLAQIGIKMTVETPSYATWLRKYLSNQWGKTDAFSLAWDSASYHDAIRTLKYYSCDKTNPFFCEPSIMPQIYATDGMMDEAKRRKALEDIEAAYHDLAPALYLVEVPYHYAMSKDVATFGIRALGVAYEQITFTPGTR
jgi:peptide/nickel transport system substrate-binding protein